MNLSMHNQALLRAILGGAVVLSGVSACSRSDRAGTGRDTTESGATAVTPSDSQTSAVSGYRGMDQDSSAQPDTLAAAGNTEPAGTGAASPLDSAGVTSDYALTADPTSADTTSAGYSEMARDTSSAAGRGDTAAVAVADTTTPAESDTATDTLTVATADSADTTSAKSEQAAAQVGNADTLQDNSGRIRPPEDSTEIRGDGNVANQSETERIRAEPTAREVPTVAAGAAPIGNTVTGIDAVSLMSRAGARCVVKDDSGDVSWDMADSPAGLNPCGTGTMTLSLVRTEEK